MVELSVTDTLVIYGLPVLLAITVHEAAHGIVANWRGDRTAAILGRLTLNPLKHIDPIGTVIVPLLLAMSSGFVFGWAKPVPVSARNLKSPKSDMALISAAGPLSNFIMAFMWAVVGKLVVILAMHYDIGSIEPYLMVCRVGVMVNLVLAWLNLIPIPPLDGSHILMAFLPRRLAYYLEYFESIGLWVIVLLMLLGMLQGWLEVPVMWSQKIIMKKVNGIGFLNP